MGASSARFAAATMQDDILVFEIVEQVSHAPTLSGPARTLQWNSELLFDLCDRAVGYASANFDEATIGVDTWGVDIGFARKDDPGTWELVNGLVAYRDESHGRAMLEAESHQERLYALTGVQRQPFNTLNQLIARRLEDATLPIRAGWMLLPDLMADRLTCRDGARTGPRQFEFELTIASTTQLMGLDCQWCEEAFAVAGWPVPELQPERPGRMIGHAAPGVEVIRVGGHDTASAVCGLGELAEDAAFMSVGTWSLLGCLLEHPLVSEGARIGNFSNERAVDGKVRFLKNMPGFFVLNRLREELGVNEPMGDWLEHADQSCDDRLDLFDDALFNPVSMTSSVIEQLGREPRTHEEWAGIALMSLAETTAAELRHLESVTGRSLGSIRAGGGGSASTAFCQAMADACGRPVVAGPVEVTVLGNLGVQLLAKGIVSSRLELDELLRRSVRTEVFHPRE